MTLRGNKSTDQEDVEHRASAQQRPWPPAVTLLRHPTWVPGVGVWELLSGVLASARAVASSLCVMGRGPAAPV